MKFFNKAKDERILFERNHINKYSLLIYYFSLMLILFFKSLCYKLAPSNYIQEFCLIITFFILLIISLSFKKISFKNLFLKNKDEYLKCTINEILSNIFYLSIFANFLLVFMNYLTKDYNQILLLSIPIILTFIFTFFNYIHYGLIRVTNIINNYTLRIIFSSILFGCGMMLCDYNKTHILSLKSFVFYSIAWGIPFFLIGKLILFISDSKSNQRVN
ncbi:hypothetical protein ACV3RW_15795 [Clostridium perfringens]